MGHPPRSLRRPFVEKAPPAAISSPSTCASLAAICHRLATRGLDRQPPARIVPRALPRAGRGRCACTRASSPASLSETRPPIEMPRQRQCVACPSAPRKRQCPPRRETPTIATSTRALPPQPWFASAQPGRASGVRLSLTTI
eukprot:5437646-Pyramimonas_sp.AAC.1